MVLQLEFNKGLDLVFGLNSEQVIGAAPQVSTLAILGRDFIGLNPRVLVKPGQAVVLGEPLLLDKHDPAIQITAPGSGRVAEVNLGKRRRLLSVVIELDESAAAAKKFTLPNITDAAGIRELLLNSGAWTGFRTRPFNNIPAADSTPSALFITAIDTRPLSADPNLVIAEKLQEFATGMRVVAALAKVPVFLCTASNWLGPEPEGKQIQRVEFSGPHPAGLPGTHIHHLHPASRERVSWHINYQDVIAIGHLFETRQLATERIISVGGNDGIKPSIWRTRTGANVEELSSERINPNNKYRILSGSILDGFNAQGPESFLGRYHHQISLIAEQPEPPQPGPVAGLYSTLLTRLFKSPLALRQTLQFDSDSGRQRSAIMPTEAFEQVIPLDILPTPLFRALLVKDTDTAQTLGCLELAEEDLALSSFVCPARLDYGTILRANLDQIQKEG